MSVSLHTKFPAAAHIADGQFLRTEKKAKISNTTSRNSLRLLLLSSKERQNEVHTNNNNKNSNLEMHFSAKQRCYSLYYCFREEICFKFSRKAR